MDWKEFLRPTIGKIILFLILSIIFLPFIKYDNGIKCFTIPCYSQTTGSILMWAMAKRYAGYVYEIYYPYLVLGIIASYFLSCLIIIIYQNQKNNKTKSQT